MAIAYDLIIIGRGTAAAQYLLTLPQRVDAEGRLIELTRLVIGKSDPWAKARGYVKDSYAQYINQDKMLLERRDGESAPRQGAQDRKAFAEETDQIIQRLATRVEDAAVVRVSRITQKNFSECFRVVTDRGDFFTSPRIVIASGYGAPSENASPTQAEDYWNFPKELQPFRNDPDVMSLDAFTRRVQKADFSLAGKEIAVIGPTAGTDAVMTAQTLGLRSAQNVHWVVSEASKADGGLKNVYMPDKSSPMHAPISQAKDNAKKNLVVYNKATGYQVSKTGQKFKVQGIDKAPQVDYIVYATGQKKVVSEKAYDGEPDAEKREFEYARSILSDDLMGLLEPVYDVNQRQNAVENFKVTALQVKGASDASGLKVIGAAAFQMSSGVAHTGNSFLDYEFFRAWAELRDLSAIHKIVTDHISPDYFKPFNELFKDVGVNDGQLANARSKAEALKVALNKLFDNSTAEWKSLDSKTQSIIQEHKSKYSDSFGNFLGLFLRRVEAANRLAKDSSGVGAMLNKMHTLPDSLSDCRLISGLHENIGALNASRPQHLAPKPFRNMDQKKLHAFDKKADAKERGKSMQDAFESHHKGVDDLLASKDYEKTYQQALANRTVGDANFLEDSTELYFYIATNFPYAAGLAGTPIDEIRGKKFVEDFISDVIREHKLTSNEGFPEAKIREFNKRLIDEERKQRALKNRIILDAATGIGTTH